MKCRECGAEISEAAVACSACGVTRWAVAPSYGAATTGGALPPPAPPRYAPPPPFVGMAPAPFPRSTPPRRRRWPVIVGACAGVIVIAGAVIGFLAFRHDGPHYPSQWDAKVAPIASKVAQLRGLAFEHPVTVHYVPIKDFEKQVSADPKDLAKQKDQLEQFAGLLRASGLIGGKIDLGKALNDTSAADTLAYYSPSKKAIYIRGDGAFTIETRVTLAHELTHVLQDQHFDLQKLDKQAEKSDTGSSDALTALVEGDAERIEDKYLADQSATDRKDYARLSDTTNNTAGDRTKGIPAVFETMMGAPYIFGPQVIGILDSTGGNSAVDDALVGPTPSSRIYLDPTALDDSTPAPAVPALRAGEKKFSTGSDDDDEFDDFTLYMMLGARIDRPTALRGADAFASGSEALYTRGGTTCIRVAMEGRDAASEKYLGTVMKRWIATMPEAALEESDTGVLFHTCDPGTSFAAPSDAAIREATSFAATRGALTKELVTKNHATTTLATCAARMFFEQPALRDSVFGKLSASPEQLRQDGAAVGLACRANPRSGLPS
jgi:hypothetical protein